MPIAIKTFNNLIALIKAKFNATLPNVDPSINGGLAQAVSVSSAVAGYALQDVIQDAVNQSFIPTQNDSFLAISGSIENIPQLQPQGASGFIAVGGTLNTNIPANTNSSYLNLLFSVIQATTINTYTGTIGTLSYNANGTVTATTNLTHTLSTGLSITISGASQSALNGTYTIIVISSTQFAYTINTNLGLNPDAGNYSAVYALLNVQCTTTGSNTNIGAGSILSINVPNVNSSAYVGVNGLINGTDLETTVNYRTRILQGYNLTPGISSIPALLSSLSKVVGVTRKWIIPASTNPIQTQPTRGSAGYLPVLGETLIYIVDDNLFPITPPSSLIASCLTQLQTDGLIPSWIPFSSTVPAQSNFWIIAPNLVTPYISLHLTNANTTSMQTAIQTQLSIFFQENATVSQNVSYKALLSFIQNIQDPNTGIFVAGNYVFNGWGFTANPTAQTDLVIPGGSLAISGTITAGTLIFN